MGNHQLSCGERDHPADFGMAGDAARQAELLSGFDRGLYFRVRDVRDGGQPGFNHCVARVLQGVAGGGLQPSSQAILLDAFPQEKQGQAMTVFGMAALLAPVVGPTLGGYITDNYGWRWIFYLNVPVGTAGFFHVPGTGAGSGISGGRACQKPASQEALRYAGAVSLERDHGLLGGNAEQGTAVGLARRSVLSGADAVDLVRAVAGRLDLSRTAAAQSADRSYGRLADRNFAACCVIIFCAYGVLYANTISLPALLQSLFGYDATDLRAWFYRQRESSRSSMLRCRRRRAGSRRRCPLPDGAAGSLIMAMGNYWMSQLNLDISPWQVVWPRVVLISRAVDAVRAS